MQDELRLVMESAEYYQGIFVGEGQRDVRQKLLRYRVDPTTGTTRFLQSTDVESHRRGNPVQEFSICPAGTHFVRLIVSGYREPRDRDEAVEVALVGGSFQQAKIEVLKPGSGGRLSVRKSYDATKPFKSSAPPRYLLLTEGRPTVVDLRTLRAVEVTRLDELAKLIFEQFKGIGVLGDDLDYAVASGVNQIYDRSTGRLRPFPEHVRTSGSVSAQQVDGRWVFLFGAADRAGDASRLVVADEQRIQAETALLGASYSDSRQSFWDARGQRVLYYDDLQHFVGARDAPDKWRASIWNYGITPATVQGYEIDIKSLFRHVRSK